jgi:hypothetical protein
MLPALDAAVAPSTYGDEKVADRDIRVWHGDRNEFLE